MVAKRHWVAISVALASTSPIHRAFAQPPSQPSSETTPAHADGDVVPMSFSDFLSRVAQGNVDLIAQRSSVSIAAAQIEIARIFPDPVLTGGVLQYDLSHQGNPTETFVNLVVPIQIGGQRGARISVAEAGLSATQADLDAFLRTLKGGASDAYIDALHTRLVLGRKRRTLASLQRLVTVNEQRLKAGDIGEAALVQSRVEAQQFHAAELGAEGEVRASSFELVRLMGKASPSLDGRSLEVQGDLKQAASQSFQMDALVGSAYERRPDMIAAQRRLVAAQRQIELARANRVVDISVGGTWQHNFATSVGTPIPASDLLGATLSVPLPLSRIYRGELDAAYAGERQARAQVESLRLRVATEVRQALTRYDAADAQVKLYAEGVLSDADQVLEKTLYNYQRGGASLVEVLVAQRTVDDVYVSYFDALKDTAHALVALQLAAGLWDVHF
jgi:cobalt-zinc-cadmium efflux system outer membrane protein